MTTDPNAIPADQIAPSEPIASRGLFASAAAAIIITAALSPKTLLVHAIEGLYAASILAAATLAGWSITDRFLPIQTPQRIKWLTGAAIGLFIFSTLVLTLGCAGIMSRTIWIAILTVAAAIGIVRLLRKKTTASPPTITDKKTTWLWLTITPFIALFLVVSVIPPGVLWLEEAHGYDVLEYHLELPKEYYETGRIEYAPHNVYANFPANAEMLYLLSMILSGDVYDGGMIAQILNAYIGIAVIAAAWAIGRESSPRAGILTAILTATTGWLVYLSGIAYVENLMLLFGFLAAACAARAIKHPDNRLWIITGLLAGAACGCKYTALPMIAAPLILAPILTRSSINQKPISATLYTLAVLAAFAPWLIKNTAMTGNPVFPLANNFFHADPPGLDLAHTEHFAQSHEPLPDEQSLTARCAAFWHRVIADPHQRIGPLLFILALMSLWMRKPNRVDCLFLTIFVAQLAVWLFATHLFARFAVVMLIPLAALAGRFPLQTKTRWIIPIIIAGIAWNAWFTWRLVQSHRTINGQPVELAGLTGLFLDDEQSPTGWINKNLPENARILLVGEARAYYINRKADAFIVFNNQPLAALCPDRQAVNEWLTTDGYTHILVNWSEITRFRNSTYGFPESITPDCLQHLPRIKTFAPDPSNHPQIELLAAPQNPNPIMNNANHQNRER